MENLKSCAHHLAWLCDELAAGNQFNPELLREWAAKARAAAGIQACEDCGIYPADAPSKLCPGCEAYQAHNH